MIDCMTFLKSMACEKRNYFPLERAVFVHLDEINLRNYGVQSRNELRRTTQSKQLGALDVDIDKVVVPCTNAMRLDQRIERNRRDTDRICRMKGLDNFLEALHRQDARRLRAPGTACMNMEINVAVPIADRIIEQLDVCVAAEFRFKRFVRLWICLNQNYIFKAIIKVLRHFLSDISTHVDNTSSRDMPQIICFKNISQVLTVLLRNDGHKGPLIQPALLLERALPLRD